MTATATDRLASLGRPAQPAAADARAVPARGHRHRLEGRRGPSILPGDDGKKPPSRTAAAGVRSQHERPSPGEARARSTPPLTEQ